MLGKFRLRKGGAGHSGCSSLSSLVVKRANPSMAEVRDQEFRRLFPPTGVEGARLCSLSSGFCPSSGVRGPSGSPVGH